MPEQQFSTLIPWMMEKYGKNVYTIAADYNFGQISAEWVRNIVKENGGRWWARSSSRSASRSSARPSRTSRRRSPTSLVTLLVGAAQASYYEQASAASLGLPMASSVNVGQGYEHKRFTPPSLKDMYVTTNYIEEIDTPASKAFVEKFHAKFPDEPYINQEAAELLHRDQPLQAAGREGGLDRPSTRSARRSPRATSASTARRARSASTRRASTCRTPIYLAHP